MIRALATVLAVASLTACSPLSKSTMTKKMKVIDQDLHDHTGFMLFDLDKNKTIFEYNSAKYFTPASNTKVFTLFSAFKILGDSIPAFRYRQTDDSLIIRGTGDPSFLYKNVFNNNRVYNFLSQSKSPVYLSLANFKTSAFGPGWAWDDYNDYYSAERSGFPLYGNIMSVSLVNQKPIISPSFFAKSLTIGEEKERNTAIRKLDSNDIIFHWGKRRSSSTVWDVPIKTDDGLIQLLLNDTLKRPVTLLNRNPFDSVALLNSKTFYSIPADSLYKVLMQESDNFIAEQILLMCSDVISGDSLAPEVTIDYVKKNFLKDLSDEPSWVDGSGLSRYNLFTPRTIVQMWQKIYAIRGRERLFPILATGGISGTLRNWYKAEKPFIFGKTGSLSNNHCLSGFLITRSGKTLIFSFMNNNFVASTSKVRTYMQDILKTIYEKY